MSKKSLLPPKQPTAAEVLSQFLTEHDMILNLTPLQITNGAALPDGSVPLCLFPQQIQALYTKDLETPEQPKETPNAKPKRFS